MFMFCVCVLFNFFHNKKWSFKWIGMIAIKRRPLTHGHDDMTCVYLQKNLAENNSRFVMQNVTDLWDIIQLFT